MSTELPKEIQQVVLYEGSIYANVGSQTDSAKLALRQGQSGSDFHAVDFGGSKRLSFPVEYRPDFSNYPLVKKINPLTGKDEDYASAWVNNLEDWSIENGETLQLMVNDYGTPAQFKIAAPLQVDMPHSNQMVFRTWVAAHRARGRIIVTVTESGSQSPKPLFEEKFSNALRGGKHAVGYQEISFNLPRYMEPVTLNITLEFEKYISEEHEVEPFLFLANPHVTRAVQKEPLVVSRRLAARDGGKMPNWLVAELPDRLHHDSTLELISGGKSLPLLQGEDVEVILENADGAGLTFRASHARDFMIYLDGKQAQRVFIGTDSSFIRVPDEFRDGTHKLIEVRDETGSQVFFATYVLLPRHLTPVDVMLREGQYPYGGALMAQAQHRYESLKRLLASNASNAVREQAAYALSVVERGYDNVKLKPLAFPKVSKPDVSIVIPAHNKVEVTYLALCSLLLAQNDASFEVIVVDDASTDETADLETFVSGITVIHNAEAQRFIRACNAGVAQAKGEYVVLLNNDVEVTSGWLDELISGFDRFDGVGAVGSKLLYPNGELQDAGGMVWGTGNPWNYGNRQNAWAPQFSYARQVDYLSGAALMTTREIWNEVGGLSSYLEPMYFEDTDFSFKIRDAGYKTFFIPASIVYHYEGMTSGTDVTTGYKRYQEVNRPKFKRQWVKAYASHGQNEGFRPDLEKDRGIVGRVLFIDYTTPRPDRDAGSYAAIQEIKLVQSLGYKVTFLPQNLASFGGYTEELQKMGVEVIIAPFFLSVSEFLEKYGADFDAFYITRYYVANETLPIIRRVAPHAKVLFNNADLHFLRELRRALSEGSEEMMNGMRDVREMELRIMRDVDVILSYNDAEHAVITSHLEGAVPVTKCPWVVDVPDTIPGIEGRTGMSFLGSFGHHPNMEGIEWFAEEILPAINTSAADFDLAVYGSGMADGAKHLASDLLRPVGFVQEIEDAFHQHRVFVAPLLSGAGIKGKVLSALAHGIPCVLSPTAAEGIGLRHGHDCFIVRTKQEWVQAIQSLAEDDVLWISMSENARNYIKETFSFETGKDHMRNAFECVDMFQHI
ncbi:GT2 family glycosyltransferase [Shimia isoporae]|uniref:GT2 family glycosyltransferase n=1 Tax=Shimia isoporae TaxID=647720 RepID=A0A4R1N8H8_9RHOB|nr:glycosyltransferase [Shimia isoporae]TCK99850.1 GT2 family glycosyltransferase [Shimia isoporae]